MNADERQFLASTNADGIFMTTVSGVQFSLSNPRARDVRISDIAWALSRIPRFNGHTQSGVPLSVAQHSLTVMKLMKAGGFTSRETLMFALLHDAHEAYIGDLTSPMKKMLGTERVHGIAYPIQVAIHRALGLPSSPNIAQKAFIRKADIDALLSERREYGAGLPATGVQPMDSVTACDEFLYAVRDLAAPGTPHGG